MEENRILDKIKKCLEMAKGKSSNPNEAEIALRQAHKLMEIYNLEMGDVLASMAGEAKVAAGSESDPPAWRVRLARACAEAFGTHFIISTPWFEQASFIFIGCAAAPELAGYAYQVLERQLQKARRDYLATQKRCKRSTKVARGDAFAHGWLDAVSTKVEQFAGVEENIADPPKQEICCSRMFGKRLTELGPIKEAVVIYILRGSEKLRARCAKSYASASAQCSIPRKRSMQTVWWWICPTPPTAAVEALDHVFRPGFKYKVMLLNLCQPGEYTDDLFAVSQPADASRVMGVLDQINGRWGRGTLRSASVPANPDWAMRRELMSQSYTTRLDHLWQVHCT